MFEFLNKIFIRISQINIFIIIKCNKFNLKYLNYSIKLYIKIYDNKVAILISHERLLIYYYK